MADVFVSYKSDDRSRAGELVASLRRAGLAVWWDQDIGPQAPWEATITAELEAAKCVIVCWTEKSVDATLGEKVQVEAHEALEQKKLLQALLDPVKPPLFFRQMQAVDLSGWDGTSQSGKIQILTQAAHDIVNGKAWAQLLPQRYPIKLSWRPFAWGAAALLGVAVLLAFLVSGGCGLWPMSKKCQPGVASSASMAVDASTLQVKGHPHGEHLQDCGDCPPMVVVKGGIFRMGSPAGEPSRELYEGPQHSVSVRSFAVGIHEVTFDEWQACLRGGGCNGYLPNDEGWGRGSRPVIHVSWNDANTYTQWLSRTTGKAYRLLTEAEWEYVARAGTPSAYWWGASPDRAFANYGAEECCAGLAQGADKWLQTAPVEGRPKNPWGLFDISGNVREWVQDCWHEGYDGAPADGSAWTEGSCAFRVSRDGGWYDPPARLRAADRWREEPTHRMFVRGFRVARSLP